MDLNDPDDLGVIAQAFALRLTTREILRHLSQSDPDVVAKIQVAVLDKIKRSKVADSVKRATKGIAETEIFPKVGG